MTYFEINWLLFSKPGTNLFVVGENSRHIDILQHDVGWYMMLPVEKYKQGFLKLRNGSTVRFVRSEDLDEKSRGVSNVKVVSGGNIKGEL